MKNIVKTIKNIQQILKVHLQFYLLHKMLIVLTNYVLLEFKMRVKHTFAFDLNTF